jgi:D-glycero-beta-D-manno-heptose-7-phosphate kinase
MTIKEALNSLRDIKVLVIGDIILDIYIHGKVERISPEAPVPVVNHGHTQHTLGGAANVAANLKGLGVITKLISITGVDTESEYLETMLEVEGISNHLMKIENRPTTSKTRIVSGNHQMLRIDHESHEELVGDDAFQIWDLIRRSIESFQPNAIVVEDYNKGLLSSDLIKNICQEAGNRSIPVIVDPKNINFYAYKGCSLFKPNLKECSKQVPFKLTPQIESLNEADAYLRSKLNHHYSLITLAEHGVYISDGTNQLLLPTQIRQVSDVSGAGDTVTAIATIGIIKALSLEQIADLSNKAAGVVCSKSGVYAITLEELTQCYN